MNRGLRASTIGVGIAFGFLITGSGFGNYTTIHQALLLRSWNLFAVFGSAVAVAAAGLALLRRTGTTWYGGPLRLPHGPTRRPHLYGAAIFGAGFGLTGTCPGGAVAMVATGGLGGLLVLAGLVNGMWLRGATTRPRRARHPAVMADQLPVQSRTHVNGDPSGHGGHGGFPTLLVAGQPGGPGPTSHPEHDQHRISAAPVRSRAEGLPELPGPGMRSARDPPASSAAGSPEMTLRLAEDHDRIAGRLNDIVAHRLVWRDWPWKPRWG